MDSCRHFNTWIHPVLVFLITFSVYCWSAPGTVVLEDDGYFILAAYFNGIAHPPGYPLYTLLAHMATWLPIGSVAYRVHVLSGLFAALACVCLWKITLNLFQERIAAYATSLSFGFSHAFWSQSIIAEVYTLNVFLISLLFINCLLLMESRDEKLFRRKLNTLFLLFGLALSNHWPLLILSTPMLIALIWPGISSVARQSFKSVPYLIFGLLPYLWMVTRSNMNPEISFYGSIENWHDFWFYISRQGYKEIDISPSASWADRIFFISYSIAETARQFGAVGLVLLLGGLIYQFYTLRKNIILALALGYLGSTVVLVCLLGFDYDTLHKAVFRPYPLVAYFCASIWLGTGVVAISRLLNELWMARINKRIPILGFAVLVSGFSFVTNLPENYRVQDLWAENYAKAILDSLPADAVLFLSSDENTGPVGYLHRVEGYREDVQLYHAKGQVFRNRLYRPFKVNINQVRSSIEDFINSSSLPVYYTNELIHEYGSEYYGLYRKVLKNTDKNFRRSIIEERLHNYWIFVISHPKPYNQWEVIHYQTVTSDGCRLLSLINEYAETHEENPEELDRLRNFLCDNLQGIYIQLDLELQKENRDWNHVDQLIKKAEYMLSQSRVKGETAQLDYYRGEVFYEKGEYENAILAHQQSINIWNHPDNPSHSKIKKGVPEL